MAKDIVLEKMKAEGLPMTRAQYLALAYLGNPPAELSAEQEAELPEQFQYDEESKLQEEPHAGVAALGNTDVNR
jgi:hypothetical protein